MRKNNDRRTVMIVAGVMLALIFGATLLAPTRREDDPKPTTYNAGPAGAKAAYLLLVQMGRTATRWTKPLKGLDQVDAAKTTLVLAEPVYGQDEEKEMSAAVKAFLQRGGRVVATGYGGAGLLPDADVKGPHVTLPVPGSDAPGLCYTTPEGPGELARMGEVELEEEVAWKAAGPKFRAEQTCGDDAVVVSYPVGQGEAIWWTSASPMTNAELKNDGDLKLLLASVGDRRDVVFDEAVHGVGRSLWSAATGLPLKWLLWQVALVATLLVFSFSRRRGPVRTAVTLPRSSPVEFAESMGDLYEKAGAHVAATEAAKRRLLRVLVRDAGVSVVTVEAGPEAIAEVLEHRLGGEWKGLAADLREAGTVAADGIAPRRALALVRTLSKDADEVRTASRR